MHKERRLRVPEANSLSSVGRLRGGLIGMMAIGLLWTAAGLAVRPAVASPKIMSGPGNAIGLTALTTKMDDLQATVHMVRCDTKELEKIGADFQRSYQFQDMLKDITLEYKQPGKLRISGKNKVLGRASIVMNGALRCYRGPLVRPKVEDLTDSPGKRQSLLEYGGLLSPETLSFMQGKFVREEMLDGQPTSVFDMTYKGVTGGSHFRVWFDPTTRLTVKREWYNPEGKLKATFYYQEPKEVAEGIWLPHQVEVKNAEGASAAVTSIDMDSVKVNLGLSDDLFTIAR